MQLAKATAHGSRAGHNRAGGHLTGRDGAPIPARRIFAAADVARWQQVGNRIEVARSTRANGRRRIQAASAPIHGRKDCFAVKVCREGLADRGQYFSSRSAKSESGIPAAIRDAFQASAHGVINETFSVTHLAHMDQAHHRYSPAAVIAVAREAVRGEPEQISTCYVERSNLSIRMANRRFTRLTNAFSKKLDNHLAAVALYVAHDNLCRVHQSLAPSARNQTTPAMAPGITDRPWSLGELIDAALAIATPDPTETAPERRRKFRVIEGGLS